MALTAAETAEIVAKVGRPLSKGSRVELDLEFVRDMRSAGFSMNQIGTWFGVTRETVRKRLNGR